MLLNDTRYSSFTPDIIMVDTIRARNYADEGTSNPPPDNVDPTGLLEAFIRHMEKVTNNMNNLGNQNHHNGHPSGRQVINF